MPMPKYITHPFLLLSAGFLLGLFLWIKLPSQQNLTQAKMQLKSSISDPDLMQITGLDAVGCLRFDALPAQKLCITDANLENLTQEKSKTLNDFLQGKWLRKALLTETQITLPLEIWDASCVTQGNLSVTQKLCPMLLTP